MIRMPLIFGRGFTIVPVELFDSSEVGDKILDEPIFGAAPTTVPAALLEAEGVETSVKISDELIFGMAPITVPTELLGIGTGAADKILDEEILGEGPLTVPTKLLEVETRGASDRILDDPIFGMGAVKALPGSGPSNSSSSRASISSSGMNPNPLVGIR